MLAQHQATHTWASRLIPSGMLLAGGFVHAFLDVAGLEQERWLARVAWGYGALVAAFGVFAPQMVFDARTSSAGPAFFPIAVVSGLGTLWVHRWMWRHLRSMQGHLRRRSAVLLAANFCGALGGGGTILAAVFGFASTAVAAPFLMLAITLATWSVVADETGRHRELLRQGLWSALVTAALSALGLSAFYTLLPALMPANGWPWLMWVCFVAALPLDPLRQWVVDGLARRFFAKSMAVKALATELEVTEQRAVHAEQLAELGKVASVVAHEVRNPLGVILAHARLLEREGVNPERLSEVRAQVTRASHFVDELLRYARPRAFVVQQVDLRTLAERAINHVRQALGTQVPMAAPSKSVTVEADPQAMVDVLVVLLSNAAIALETTDEPRIDVHVQASEATVSITVEDNGPGVPLELAPRLFELFATGRGRDHRHPGVGLGLAIARQHALRHGGTLHHERRQPQGARFTLTVPMASTGESRRV
jgi:signal transduction histidine kinase